MKPALAILTVAVALFALHRLGIWMEARGWIYYRSRRGSGSSLGNALLEVHSLVEPSLRATVEVRRREPDGEETAGDPPEPGRDEDPRGAP